MENPLYPHLFKAEDLDTNTSVSYSASRRAEKEFYNDFCSFIHEIVKKLKHTLSHVGGTCPSNIHWKMFSRSRVMTTIPWIPSSRSVSDFLISFNKKLYL